MELFAGLRVRDFATARRWYERLLGGPPSFLPHETEAVWELGEHRFVYIVEEPERAGCSVVTLFVEDLEGLVEASPRAGWSRARRDLRQRRCASSPSATRGNEVGIGGGPE